MSWCFQTVGNRPTHSLVLGSGEQWWTWPAQLKGQTSWTLAWRESAGTSGGAAQWAGPRWKLPHCRWTAQPSLEVKVCLSLMVWVPSAGHHLGCPCCRNPASGNEQLILPALFNNWLQNWGGLGYVPAPLEKPYGSLLDCKSTSSEAATITFKNHTWKNSVQDYSSGKRGEANKTLTFIQRKEKTHKTSEILKLILPVPSSELRQQQEE